MSVEIRHLEPQSLWNHFADLNAVPRPSKKEERVIAFIKAFGESLHLPTQIDAAGNVIIKKPATAGMENRTPVVMQSHLDMVHQKNADTVFDFDTQGIDMYVDGDWVRAKGTTLGADNGIGVASIMAILASTDIAHPPLEALFTIDEETGMTGAFALAGGLLNGRILLNLDTEEDHELTIGCAGGIDVTATACYTPQMPTYQHSLRLSIKGLTGGHSGTEIHLGRANANKLMNRLLWELKQQFSIEVGSIDGGSLRNAIPRESLAHIVCDANQAAALQQYVHQYIQTLQLEYKTTDPKLFGVCEVVDLPSAVLPADILTSLLNCVYACPNGIYRMSPDIAGLVQTSNNVARISVNEGKITIMCLTRSSVESEKLDLAHALTACFQQMGALVETAGSYPGWIPDPHSDIVTLMSQLYKTMFHEEAHVMACHAGLECGILGRNYPGMQMISFGPNIYGAHSPDERVQVSSVQKFWSYLLETLKQIPVAA